MLINSKILILFDLIIVKNIKTNDKRTVKFPETVHLFYVCVSVIY